MENNTLKENKPLEEQLEDLRKELGELEEIYEGRKKLGDLAKFPDYMGKLASEILDIKTKIEDLEEQVLRKRQRNRR